ncbi:MAG: RMD1 family protein [Thiotrichales bacterium]|nr:RMD1 family protein [Thiotrichales bacterium]
MMDTSSPASKIAQINLLSVYLPADFSHMEVADKLNIPLIKGIEASFYAEISDMAPSRFLFFTQFDVITFVNWPKEEVSEALKKLGLTQSYEQVTLYQDYNITLNADATTPFHVDNNQIELRELSLWPLMIVSLVIAQSVGLEKFEKEVDRFYSKGRNMVETSTSFSWMKRHEFADYAIELSLLRHDMVLDLMLLDKPNILWDNEAYEQLYNRLAELLDLQERFEVVSYKLNTLKEDITMMIDLYQHKHSSFLEWIIILLILVEVFIGFWEIFFKH